jgi:hypothetical protein
MLDGGHHPALWLGRGEPGQAGVLHQPERGEVRRPGPGPDGADLGGPGTRREGNRGADPVSDPGVDDGGDVAGAGQVAFGDRVVQDLPGVQAGQFGGVQRPP